MEAHNVGQSTHQASTQHNVSPVRRLTTETKQAFKTTEFWAFVAVVAGILISAAKIKGGVGEDTFLAQQAWLYVAIVTGLYIVGRGLAKSGSRDPYDDSH